MSMQPREGHRGTSAWRVLARRLTGRQRPAYQATIEDLLYQAGKSASLPQLLVEVPNKICTMLQLQSFDVFLREGSRYVQQSVLTEPLSLPASGAVLAHLKREGRPVMLQGSAPDAWMLLATPVELQTLAGTRASMLLPLHGRTGLLGFAALAPKAERGPLTAHEIRLLQSFADQMGTGLEAARFQQSLTAEALHRERVERELELAREVQERLLPQQLPAAPGLEVVSTYRSAEQVGGDYFDAFSLPDGRLCYVIADVSGKGVPAALLMATLRASLRSLMLREQFVPAVLHDLNRLLYEASSASRYATLMLFVYDPQTGELTSANAGHTVPLVLRGDAVLRLQCGGPVVGLLPDASYEHERTPLQEGDLLLAYTDGVSEATNPSGAEWAEEGLLTAARQTRGMDAQAAMETILRVLREFTAGAPPQDDLTLLLLRRRPAGSAAPAMVPAGR